MNKCESSMHWSCLGPRSLCTRLGEFVSLNFGRGKYSLIASENLSKSLNKVWAQDFVSQLEIIPSN